MNNTKKNIYTQLCCDMDFSSIREDQGILGFNFIKTEPVSDNRYCYSMIFTGAKIEYPSIFYPKCFDNYNIKDEASRKPLNSMFRERFCKVLGPNVTNDFFIYKDEFDEFLQSEGVRGAINQSACSYEKTLKSGLGIVIDSDVDNEYLSRILDALVEIHVHENVFPMQYLLAHKQFRARYFGFFGVSNIDLFERFIAFKSSPDSVFTGQTIVPKNAYQLLKKVLTAPQQTFKALEKAGLPAGLESEAEQIRSIINEIEGALRNDPALMIQYESTMRKILHIPGMKEAVNGKDKAQNDSGSETDDGENGNSSLFVLGVEALYHSNTTRALLDYETCIDNRPMDLTRQEVSSRRANSVITLDLSGIPTGGYMDLRHGDRCSIVVSFAIVPTPDSAGGSVTGLPFKSIYCNLHCASVMCRKPSGQAMPKAVLDQLNYNLARFTKPAGEVLQGIAAEEAESKLAEELAEELFEDDELRF